MGGREFRSAFFAFRHLWLDVCAFYFLSPVYRISWGFSIDSIWRGAILVFTVSHGPFPLIRPMPVSFLMPTHLLLFDGSSRAIFFLLIVFRIYARRHFPRAVFVYVSVAYRTVRGHFVCDAQDPPSAMYVFQLRNACWADRLLFSDMRHY